jgi:pyruvate dehydrogenase E2 component (dihydrolipoamide acetyltransferase)
MATDIVMPNLGFDTQSGQVIEWYKQPGDPIEKGEALALVEADKSNVDLESIASGILLETLVSLGEDIDVGTVIARVGTQAEYTGGASAPVAAPQTAPSLEPQEEASRISPVARRMAEANNVDLSTVTGSGVRGRIMRGDVEAHLAGRATNGANNIPMALPKVRKAAHEAGINLTDLGIFGRPITFADLDAHRPPTPEPLTAPAPAASKQPTANRDDASATPLSRMRQTIGRRLVASKQQAPHFYVTGEFDLTDALDQLTERKAKVNDLLQYLTVQALLEVPELNATFEADTVYTHDNINLAIAVALDAGLMTPVLHKADHYSLSGLAEHTRDLVKRTRAGKLLPEELRGGTFTISNLGIIPQVKHFTAIINPPQVGILAVGTVKQRPVVMNGGFHARHTVHMTLSGDHRVVDGMHLGRFMAAYQAALDHFTR